MRVLLEFGRIFYIFAYCFLSFLRVLLECGSYSRAGLFRGFTVYDLELHKTIDITKYELRLQMLFGLFYARNETAF